jgi:hypothetical protein
MIPGPMNLPIPPTGPVLEVGSGGRPHPRATVLVDRYLSDEHREGRGLVRDTRPLVIADAAALPFKKGAFVYSLAVHVLEHVEDAPGMLAELERVSQAGYIETPTPLHDFLFCVDPYPTIHLWWVQTAVLIGNRTELLLRRKTAALARQPFGELLDELRRTDPYLEAWMEQRPRLFTTQFQWRDRIAYRVEDPDSNPAPDPIRLDADPRWSRRGFHWGTGLWGWKRWLYAWMVHPRWRKLAKRLAGSIRSRP